MKFFEIAEKKFGKGTIFLLGDSAIQSCPVIPTGSLILDDALGVGGIPKGRITEIYGPESSGKTTLCEHIIAEAQAMGEVAAFVDVEHALDMDWARTCGVDIANLYVSQPDNGEQALDLVEIMVRSGEVGLIIIDSVAALAPRAEIEGDMGDSHMALVARLMSQAMRKLSGAIAKSNCAVIFTNQLRQKVGVVFGNPETTTGGMALRFYASVRIDLRHGKSITEGGTTVGNSVKVTIRKNKVAPPYKQVYFEIFYDRGISHHSELIKLGIESELIQKGGSWFTIGENRFHGESKLRNALESDSELCQSIEDKIRINMGFPIRRIA